MSESSPCPEPEVLAAFLDGRLSGKERRRVVAHLDACGDCYELFSEAVRFQGEEEPRGRLVGAERFGRPRWLWPAVAAAAVLVVLVAVPILRMESERPVVATLTGGEEAVSSRQLVASLAVPDTAELASALRPRLAEGPGFAERTSREAAAFRAGVWLVHVQAAGRAAEADPAEKGLRELAATLEDAGVAARLDEDVREALAAAKAERFGDVAEAAGAIERRTRALLPPLPLALGAWAEAGRLAAATGDTAYFASPGFAMLYERTADADLPASVGESLTRIRELAQDGEVDPAELEELEEQFRELTATY